MNAIQLVPAFLVGLMGSVHCVGMCGGIVSALSVASRPHQRRFPVPVRVDTGSGRAAVAQSAHPLQHQAAAFDGALRVVSYNAGRIGSYMAAGALAGGLSGSLNDLAGIASLQRAGYWLSSLMLVALGLYLMDAWRGLAAVETAGRVVWRRVQPLMKHFLPMDHPGKALALGALWGWVPCGMVYSMLLTAAFSGSATLGASVMLAFGLGTLPMLLALGLAGGRLSAMLNRRSVRLVAGLVVLSFGLAGIARAADPAALLPAWLESICVTPVAGSHR